MISKGEITNGHALDTSGGVGGAEVRWQQRQHLRIVEEAVRGGWAVPAEAMTVLPREIYGIANDPNASPRDRIRATELLASLRKQDIDTAIGYDRIVRLEAGTATDRIEVIHDLGDQALDAVAQSLNQIQPAPKCLPKPKRKPKRKA